MAKELKRDHSEYRLEPEQLQILIDALQSGGYEVVGPTVKDQVIVYDRIQGVADLPVGLTGEQDRGRYRLEQRDDEAYFGYAVGPHSWKKYLFPPEQKLWEAYRNGKGFVQNGDIPKPRKLAFLGVRPCEIHAIQIQDKVFTQGDYKDPFYSAQREIAFLVAVNCSFQGNNCFCASLNTGPGISGGCDLILTEVFTGKQHYFVVQTGSRRGKKILEKISIQVASAEERAAAAKTVAEAAVRMRKSLDTANLKEVLYANYEHPEWRRVAERCLSCGNCTMVCPTCFCSTVEDVTDLKGEVAWRVRRWDSCFTLEHSYIHGGSIRTSAMSRYRQWLTHKLATWVDQFGVMGCVGCGRCITWCPVGIDLTQEAKVIQRDHLEKVSNPVKEN